MVGKQSWMIIFYTINSLREGIYETTSSPSCPPMISSSILLNPSARVYNLRFLLIATIPIIPFAFVKLLGGVFLHGASLVGLASGIIIWVHHIFALFHWTLRGLAVVDLAMVLIEIAGLVYLTSNTMTAGGGIRFNVFFLPLIAPLPFLFFSLLFRSMTVLKTKEKPLVQRFIFFGCCAKPNPPYTVASILLNRALARPLVRGESKYIIIARAVVLSGIGVGVPAFGIYVTMIEPAAATATTTLTAFPQFAVDLPGPATISFEPSNENYYSHPWDASVTAKNYDSNKINCPFDGAPRATCPYAWSEIQTISFSADVPSRAGFLRVWIGCDSGECDDDVFKALPVLLLPGSQLFGSLAWSQRQTISQSKEASYVVFSPEVHDLQQNTSAEGNISSLTLSVVPEPIRFFRDTADASALSGIATFGGFWTFVDGTFALFFGANIVYFAFGRRPLSALGVVHLFQRRALARKWYEDFPAIQTEGDLPGSENAGIVAFIRERLVDLDEDPRDIEQRPRVSRVRAKIGRLRRQFPWKKKVRRFNSRVQARTSAPGSEDSNLMHNTVSLAYEVPLLAEEPHGLGTSDPEVAEPRSRREYILDEIPPMDMDLGFEDGAQNTQEIKDTFLSRN
ncbi:hypothetical protein MSAN_01799000 [Mycena sanguinolenta]|uniref:Uncharacterized protein n=1 Tax=Mycena sanguinolenta TaxID=230812 RepID=A0A8H7CQN6_9AGAR|nr:hypothetical protein MSAN_01799000 [Mycena sanguinolenta]